ncbi:MAG: DUF1289 domain-containing protein [Pseudomonadota bacterium]
MTAPRIRTPCIGICSTTYGGDVCRGCRRFAHEIIDWNAYSEEQKQLVWDRLTRLVDDVVAPRLHIFDPDLMAQTLRSLGVRYHADQSPSFGAVELLRALGHQRLDLSRFGLVVMPAWNSLAPGELYREITDDLLVRSEAAWDLHHGRARRLLQNWDG